MDQDEKSWKRDSTNAVRGLFMGAADVVPGVSGGTVALITGIYQRLITAISHFDLTLLGYVRRRKWKQVANHVDLRFLCTLLFGIATGFLCMTVVMHELLTKTETRSLAFAAFFGMILASGLLVVRMIKVREKGDVVVPIVLGLIGAVFAYWLTTLKPNYDETNIPSQIYLFFCGSVAICAMILPGISGAMISLILGVYVYMIKIPRDLVQGLDIGRGLASIAAFGCGAIISLIIFSKFLRRLLERFPSPTMGLLCGLMLGSLPMLWPFFQVRVVAGREQFERFMPNAIDGHVLAVVAIAIAGLLLVLGVDRLGHRTSKFV